MTFEKPKRHVECVFLHCSASTDRSLAGQKLVDEVRRWHLHRGFQDVGYHVLIDMGGMVLKGRDLELIPAAQKGHNTGSIAICAHGLEFFPEVQLNNVQRLCWEINEAYKGRISYHGHCEVSNKTCPVLDYKSLLQLDRWGRMP